MSNMAMEVQVKFEIGFKIPNTRAMSSGDRRRFADLVEAGRFLDAVRAGEVSIVGDRSHFSDVTDAVVTLANVIKRARASKRRER